MSIVKGTKRNDSLLGTSDADEIYGLGGDDTINPGFGADKIAAGRGDDTIIFTAEDFSAPTADGSIAGGAGDDMIDLTAISDFDVSMTNDAIYLKIRKQLFAISGIETIQFGSQRDLIAPDVSYAGPAIAFRAGGGRDDMSGSGNYAFYGEAGDDRVFILPTAPTTKGIADGGSGMDELTLAGEFTLDLAQGTATASGATYTIAGFEMIAAFRDSIVLGSDGADDIRVSVRFDGIDGHVAFSGRGGADRLTGSQGRDDLDGGAGNDLLSGGRGADTLTGGADADRFIYRTFDSTANDADVIADFQDGVDRIDLSLSDAKSASFTLDPFTFIGRRAFTGRPGQLRYGFDGQATLIEGDTDGDRRADLVIRLDGQYALTEANFILHPESGIPFGDRTLLPLVREEPSAQVLPLV